jgi:hypothetical protein
MHHVKMASSCIAVAACLLLAAGGSVRQANSQAASPTLDYQFFKDKVQAVFLHKREGHTRCVACHTVNNVMTMHLVPLSPGVTTWNEEQSRQNFQWVQRVVVPGYEDSLLLKHPLAEAAGGDPRHGGGQQFASKNDPDWQTLKSWVMGAK